MNEMILATLKELISEYKIINIEEISIENGDVSYEDVHNYLVTSGVPLIVFPNDEGIPLIVRADAEWDSDDISDYLDRENFLSDKQIQYLEFHWGKIPKYIIEEKK